MPFEDFVGRWKIYQSNQSTVPPGTSILVDDADQGLRSIPGDPDAVVVFRDQAQGRRVLGVAYAAAEDQLIVKSFFLRLEERPGLATWAGPRLVHYPNGVFGDSECESWVAEEDDT